MYIQNTYFSIYVTNFDTCYFHVYNFDSNWKLFSGTKRTWNSELIIQFYRMRSRFLKSVYRSMCRLLAVTTGDVDINVGNSMLNTRCHQLSIKLHSTDYVHTQYIGLLSWVFRETVMTPTSDNIITIISKCRDEAIGHADEMNFKTEVTWLYRTVGQTTGTKSMICTTWFH